MQQSLKSKVIVKEKILERNEKNSSNNDEMRDIQGKYAELSVLSSKEN